MSTIIHKQLATKQDLALGKGSITQERNGNLVSLDLIDFISDQELAELTGLNFSTVSSMVENTTGVVYKIGMSLTVQGENDQINNYVVVSEVTDIALSGGLYAKHLATTSSSLETALEEEIQARQDAVDNLQNQISGAAPLAASAFSVVSWHDQVILNSITVPENKNAWSFGPMVTIAPGQSVTLESGSYWTVAEGNTTVTTLQNYDEGIL